MTPPASDEALAWVHRGWDHLRRQRPLAAWASWNRALRIEPDQPAATEALAILAGADDLPAAARTVYRFRPPLGDDRRARWDAHFRGRDLAELEPAAAAFAELGDADLSDSAARYNQALALAWLGRNVEAIAALESVVEIDAPRDFEAAVNAWMLAEVLRHGAGAEELADDYDYAYIFEFEPDDPDPATFLEPLSDSLRPIPVPAESGVKVFEIFEWGVPGREGVGKVAPHPLILTAIASARTLRFSTPSRDAAWEWLWGFRTAWCRERSETGRTSWTWDLGRMGQEPGDLHYSEEATPLPFPLLDAAVLTFRLPEGLEEADRKRLCREWIELFYEKEWPGANRRGLAREVAGLSPIDAAQLAASGDLVTKAKLTALVRFREQLSARPSVVALYGGYPFDRLRRRLGLELVNPATVDPADLSCIGMEEAMRLDLKTLDEAQLEEIQDITDLATRTHRSREYEAFSEAILIRQRPELADWFRELRRKTSVEDHPADEAET